MSRNYQENKIRPLLAIPPSASVWNPASSMIYFRPPARHQLDIVLANQALPSASIAVCIANIWAVSRYQSSTQVPDWKGKSLRVPEDLDGLEMVLPGPCVMPFEPNSTPSARLPV